MNESVARMITDTRHTCIHTREAFFETHLILTKRIVLNHLSSRGRSSWTAHRVFEDANIRANFDRVERDLNERGITCNVVAPPRRYTTKYNVLLRFNRKPLPTFVSFLFFVAFFFSFDFFFSFFFFLSLTFLDCLALNARARTHTHTHTHIHTHTHRAAATAKRSNTLGPRRRAISPLDVSAFYFFYSTKHLFIRTYYKYLYYINILARALLTIQLYEKAVKPTSANTTTRTLSRQDALYNFR